jgi:hypothetical protein
LLCGLHERQGQSLALGVSMKVSSFSKRLESEDAGTFVIDSQSLLPFDSFNQLCN